MGCPPVRGDNPRALSSELPSVQVDKHGITILYHLHQCRPSHTVGSLPVRGDNPRALASGLSYVLVDQTWYNYLIPPTSV